MSKRFPNLITLYILGVYFMSSVRKSAQCYYRAFMSILINVRRINYKYIIATNNREAIQYGKELSLSIY